jgi:hypothetical protein
MALWQFAPSGLIPTVLPRQVAPRQPAVWTRAELVVRCEERPCSAPPSAPGLWFRDAQDLSKTPFPLGVIQRRLGDRHSLYDAFFARRRIKSAAEALAQSKRTPA